MKKTLLFSGILLSLSFLPPARTWESKFVKTGKNGDLHYVADDKGNRIPDFSRVGYYGGDQPIPSIPVVMTVAPTGGADDGPTIQAAIDALSQREPGPNGFRGALLLKRGVYKIPGTLHIRAGGIVLRGEGDTPDGSRLVATGSGQRTLIEVSGDGGVHETPHTRTAITDDYVPTGATSFQVAHPGYFKAGDPVILYRPGTEAWIRDLRMDQILARKGTRQWQPHEYDLSFERVVTKIKGHTVFIDNPVVLAMEPKYGGGELFKYEFDGRIDRVGIEDIYCESAYAGDTDEDHGWNAITFNKIDNGWVRQVTARYFGYACVNLGNWAKHITVTHCQCLDAKSIITGGRRYSFCNNGQLNLFTYCHASEGRHDYVTGARVCGPNVFFHCTADHTHADIGPHHRWAMGTLFDNIMTDGEINVQDRGNWGSGHGWSGVTQVIWNCTAKRAAVQNPWASGKNYCIGLQGGKYPGRFDDRPDGEWEGQNKEGLEPASLYLAQLKERRSNP